MNQVSKSKIPQISDEELMRRYEKIKPVVRKKGKLYYLREFTLDEVKNISYLWNADSGVREEVGEGKLEVLEGKSFKCFHTYAAPCLFKPSIREVLAQIKKEDLPLVKAFRISEPIIVEGNYHISTVILYG